MFKDLPEVLPEGSSGVATVSHFVIDKNKSDATAMRAAACGQRDAFIPPGAYVRLHVGHTLMMSDTPMERRSNTYVVREARGHVLISGLGVGMILHPILAKPEVTSVTVVEKYGDVIRLVEPSVRHPKLTVIEADIFEWKPAKGTKYDVVYHDIWPNITIDNLKEMATLNRRFARYKAPGAWVNSWMRERLLALRSREGKW